MDKQRSTIAWDLLAKGLAERCGSLPAEVWMDLSCAMKVDSLGGVQVEYAQLVARGPTKPPRITFPPCPVVRVRTGPTLEEYKYVPGDQVLFQAVSFRHHNSFGFYSEPQGAGRMPSMSLESIVAKQESTPEGLERMARARKRVATLLGKSFSDNSNKGTQSTGSAHAHIAGMKYAMKLAIEAWAKGDPECRTSMPQCLHELGDAIKVLEQFKQEGPK